MDRTEMVSGRDYVVGGISFVAVFCIVWLIWYVVMHPDGVMKLYTPMYGFSLAVVFLAVVVLMSRVLDLSPSSETSAPGTAGIGQGILLTAVAVVLTLIVTYGVFWGFIGRLGVAYFSPQSIVASGGTGAEPFVARENASTAIIYFCSAFLWWALTWKAGFGEWPWIAVGRGVLAWSRFSSVMLFTVITYVVLFHPHVCYLFYPPQNKAGVEPWWASFAGTGSAFFSLGLILCALAWVVITDLCWEGYPWKALDKNGRGSFLKGLFTLLGTFVLGLVTFVVLLKIMNYYWMEPFEGGQYTDAPYFRYLHAGEFAGFLMLAAFILKTYFTNFPHGGAPATRGLIRTGIVLVGAIVIRWFYYSAASTLVLGKVPGIAQPDDTPLVWTILFLSVIMVHADFFESRPMRAQHKPQVQ
jgi:amino acid transporter, AAT family